MKIKKAFLISTLLCVVSFTCIFSAFAHSGRTDANGGHWDRKNGTYHFHTGEYSGKSSSSSSSTHESVYFTPPYEPPTVNPYRNNQKVEVTSDAGETNVLGNVFLALIGIWFAISFIYWDFKNNGGCLILGASAILLIYLIGCLIAEYTEGVIGVVVVVFIFVPIIKALYTQYESAKTDVDNYQKLFYEIDKLNKDVVLNDEEVCVPELYEIGEDDLPKEKECASDWGKSFTLYKTEKGYKLHAKYNCCLADKPVHIYWYRNYRDAYEMMCKKCAFNYDIPDMAWYDYYLKCKQAKKNRERLLREIEASHEKCNSAKVKASIFFSRKTKAVLKEANKKYKKLKK